MPEIKHNFTGGKMNRDVDQRLVPKGEYRDAMNIQVSTSDGSDVGTVQNILGNKELGWNSGMLPLAAQCVGAISDEKNDALYWFVTSPSVLEMEPGTGRPLNADDFTSDSPQGSWENHKSMILQLKDGDVTPVFVSKTNAGAYTIAQTGDNITWDSNANTITFPSSLNIGSLEVGMTLQGNNNMINQWYMGMTISSINTSTNTIVINGDITWLDLVIGNYAANQTKLFFVSLGLASGHVLGFNSDNLITGINILDDMLFWTDGVTEPKKINIPRSIQGTHWSGTKNTRLINAAQGISSGDKVPVKEEHITVIKRAPKKGLSMNLTTDRDPNLNYSGIFTISDTNNLVQSSLWGQRNPLTVTPNLPYDLSTFTTKEGSNIILVRIKSDLSGNTSFNLDGWGVGSKVVIREVASSGNIPAIPINDYTIKGVVTDWLYTNSAGVTSDVNQFNSGAGWGVKLAIKVNSISRTPKIAVDGTLDYVIDLFDESEKLYEFKLPRFSYRYKYEDGEYSYFAPWTDIAFKPGSFDYHPKKGYNLGMTNLTKAVHLGEFITADIPKDVVEIDILYKEEKSPNIYVVDTLNPKDYPTVNVGGSFFNNWDLNELTIEKENIMSTLPSNQLLRSYDNVPKNALTQDITGNRIVYGNYTQNYTLAEGGVNYKPRITHELIHDNSTLKSVKSLREYQLGVVFTDKYGRETPVLTNNTGTFKVEKNQGTNKNKIQSSLGNTDSPADMEFFKFYIKEISGEYYNLAMDRWYDAKDSNVWVSFNSADRNKVNDDSILILKKGVDSEELVEDPARFKVVAIENEAPDYIKFSKTVVSDKTHTQGIVPSNIFLTGADLPEQHSNSFSIAFHDDGVHVYSNTAIKDIHDKVQHPDEEFYFQIKNSDGTIATEPIKITTIKITDDDWADSGGLTKFDIVLETPFTTLVNSFTDDITGLNSTKILDGNRAVFWSYKKENKPEFDGRFFVKLFQEDTFKEYIVNNTSAEITEYNAIYDQKIYSFDYGSHNLVFNNVSGNISEYLVTHFNNNTSVWGDYISATDDIAQDGSSGSSLENWKICAAYFRGINVHRTKSSIGASPGFKSHGMTAREGFDGMDLHGDPSSWGFEDVWFLDGATSDGQYGGHWNGNPSTTNHTGVGITGNTMELGFGGIQPEHVTDGSYAWAYDSGGPSTDPDFYQLENNTLYDNDSEGNGLASRLTSGVVFRWAEDPTQTVYKIDNTATHNLVRHETDDLGGDQRLNALGATGSPYPLYNDITYHTSTFFRPGNHSKNYALTVTNLSDPTNTTMPWNPYTSGEIANGLNIPLTVDTGMSAGGNQITVDNTVAIDISGHNYGARSVQVGMVCDELGAIVSKIVNKTLYFKNYNANNANPNYAAVSNGDILHFKQYGMNGISRNSAKNINYWNNGKGFGATNVGVDAVGYTIEICEPIVTETMFPRFPAVFETEPSDETGLDIYYEMTDNLPVKITNATISSILPVGSPIAILAQDALFGYQDGFTVLDNTLGNGSEILIDSGFMPGLYSGDEIIVEMPSGSKLKILIDSLSLSNLSPFNTIIKLNSNLTNQKLISTWFNCFSFGNGVESNRVRDAFNMIYISNGVKASSTISEQYKQEHRAHSLIYSGIYNSTSGVNNLNQFITAEKITKDINPIYGSIQKLYAGWGQGGDLIALCEDRILKILANKDALFNADGNSNVTSTNNVLGQAIPYSGEYGISKNPESFASEAYRIYFTDKVRGTVMRLSMDGLTPISNHGMKDWFRDKLKLGDKLIGSYDDKKDEYNVAIKGNTIAKTVTFREDVKGWVSFKSFTLETAISCANEYYTFLNGNIWKHHDETADRNTFHDQDLVPSTLEVIFNEVPGSVKSFKTVSYEGSQAKVTSRDENNVIFNDGEYFNLADVPGWHVTNVITNLEQGGITEFINKEGKWFGYVTGNDVTINPIGNVSGNYDTEDSSIQGVGRVASVVTSVIYGCMDATMFNYNSAATIDDGSCVAIVNGCIDASADNFNGGANTDDGTCYWLGCTQGPLAVWSDPFAGDANFNASGVAGSINFDSNATVDDGSCTPAIYGCTIPGNFNFNPSANLAGSLLSDGTPCGSANCMCIPLIYGCTDPNADIPPTFVDEMTDINTEDGSCTYSGCTDPIATNYSLIFAGSTVDGPNGNLTYLNGNAVDDGSCTYVGGCMDAIACNYDSAATIDNGSCSYCGDSDAENFTAPNDLGCVTNCEYCSPISNIQILSQTTSDVVAGVDQMNGTAVISFSEPTNAYGNTVVIGNWVIDQANSITPSTGWGSGTITFTATGLSVGTFNGPTSVICTANNTGNSWAAGAGVVNPPLIITTTVTPILGCTDNTGVNNNVGGTWGACNYDATANTNDGSCEYTTCTGCNDNTFLEFCGDCWDTINQVVVASGGSAWIADTIPTSCTTLIVPGCMDATAINFDAAATVDDGSCIAPIPGCMDDTLNNDGSYAASNYSGPPVGSANVDDGSCLPYNCPYDLNVVVASTNFSFKVLNFTTPYPFGQITRTATIGGTTITSFTSSGNVYQRTDTIGKRFYEPITSYFTAGVDTSITVDFNVTTTDGNCDVDATTKIFTIGCTDATADNSGSFDIIDDTQCEYSGCTDATACNYNPLATTIDPSDPCLFCSDVNATNYDGASCNTGCIYSGCDDSTLSVMSNSVTAASNYDVFASVACGVNFDNECCTYHDDQDIEAIVIGGGGYYMLRVNYDPESTGYTEAEMSSFTLGEAPGLVTTTNNVYPMSNMTASMSTRVAVVLNPSTWETYVYNDQLKITTNADFNGACDNDFLSDQLPTGSASKTFTFSVGCKDDSTAVNFDPNVDLHLASTCIEAKPGCMDSTAENYDSTANLDCTFDGSANPNDCCCYTCDEPTWDATNPVVVNTWNDPINPTYATQITFNFASVDTAVSYQLWVEIGGQYINPISNLIPTSITNGIASYVYNSPYTGTTWFQNESTYEFQVIASCENGDGDSCGNIGSGWLTLTLND